ncbi:MAG: hypothetical protein D6772_09550, partial [Bacteroidetes bacterium]
MRTNSSASAIDWTSLFADDALASQGLQQLLSSQTVCLPFVPNDKVLAALWNLYWTYRMGIRQKGQFNLYFTYPSFYSEASGRLPLLRWPCRLRAPTAPENTWTLEILGELAPQVNPQWLGWAEANFPHPWSALLQEVQKATDRTAALRKLAAEMVRETPWTLSNPDPGLLKEASLLSFTEEMRRGGLAWVASLAIHTEPWYPGNAAGWRRWARPEARAFPYAQLLSLSPSQVEAWAYANQEGRLAVAQRASLDGTTGMLLPSLVPYLVAGEAVLVVARDQVTLAQATHTLTVHGWGALLTSWLDEQLDWPILQARIQSYLKSNIRANDKAERS